jgi:hypothetical protein
MEDTAHLKPPGDVRPDPDPTRLTTAALLREIGALRAELNITIDGLRNLVTRAFVQIDDMPRQISEAVDNLQQLHDQKFKGVTDTFTQAGTALAAALTSAEKAVNEQNKANSNLVDRIEKSFTKQIDQLQDLISSGFRASDVQVSDAKSRLDRIEAKGIGGQERTQEIHTTRADNTQTTAVIVSIAAVIVAVILAFAFQHHS